MKTDRINSIFGVILKGVATICIVLITFIYWQSQEIGKYKFSFSADEESLYLTNTTTGEVIGLGATYDDDNSDFMKYKVNFFGKDSSEIFKDFEYFSHSDY